MKFFLLYFTLCSTILLASRDCSCLFQDLALVEEINHELEDELPFFYNFSLVGGYFNMPSARFPKEGDFALGFCSVPPYYVYGANFAIFSRIELSANYRVFRGMLEPNFGKDGFGDDADRVGNVKFGILVPEDQVPYFPSLAFGLDDFIGTKRFSSQYFVATKTWKEYNFELSLGWGRGRLKGPFGGAIWTPFRQTNIPILKNISLIAEYDANNYKKHSSEHFEGRSVTSRFNGGLSYVLGNTLQVSVSSVRGEKVAASVSLRYPLGTTEGLIPKIDDPFFYTCPIDREPLGFTRPEKEFIADLACSFANQGLDLYQAYLFHNANCGNELHLTIVNNRYREEACVRERIEDVLAALTPSNVARIKVVIESAGVVSHSYCFRTSDLYSYRDCCMGLWELETLSPIAEAGCPVDPYEAELLFKRRREVWTFTVRPRVISFFGSTTGKFKYSLGALTSLQGFVPGGVFYRIQGSYSAYSSMHGLLSQDSLNPSFLIHVRTDAVKYYQGGKVRLEEAYLQRSWNMGKGWFSRFSAGYFEPAFGGGAAEVLLYPVQSNWAVGAEVAVLWKREYNTLGFMHRVPKFTHNHEVTYVPYTGLQYFLNIHYNFKPLDLLFEIKAGQFLAKDKGVRVAVTRYFPSGVRFSLWGSYTNGHDKVNGHTYFDKGFAFVIPFDIFLKQSSRTLLNYGMSAWLRDVAAVGFTGNSLFQTLYEERYD